MDDLEAAQLEAERIAREAEEARRRALLAKISELESERDRYQSIYDRLYRLRNEAEAKSEEIGNETRRLPLAGEGDFKCLTEEEITGGVNTALSIINMILRMSDEACVRCAVQNNAISERIDSLNLEIQGLRNTI